ncbi:MAG TPA: alpha/beta hydrolase [Reyranella sp.]|nr:alpha/beta hydrolase [Reyranella sp.]
MKLAYELLGNSGPWVAVSPGGRRGLALERPLGILLAEAGFRVLLYDRRNTGASEIGFPGQSESHEQAADLLALLKTLQIGPAYIAGCSSGSRLSLLLALHHPDAVKALVLWRVTGGAFAAKRLAFNYYEQFIAAAEQGGLDAVARTEHFAAMIAANPDNRKILDGLGIEAFVAAMRRWLAGFHQGSGHPVAGLTPAEMRSITLPALIIPGNDRTHPKAAGQAAHRLLPDSEYRELMGDDLDVDVDLEGWEKKTGTLAATFIDFLRRRERVA